MITEPKLTIERKGIDAFEVRNLLHIVMLAEPGWVIPAGRYERRYVAFAVSTTQRGQRGYFRALHDQIQNGGGLWNVVDAVNEVLDRIEQQKVEPDLPEGIMALPLLQMAYRGKLELTPQQMRAAIEALPFEVPKLSAAAITSMDEKSFAAALERAIERSRSPVPLLNAPVEQIDASEMKKPFPRNYRRF